MSRNVNTHASNPGVMVFLTAGQYRRVEEYLRMMLMHDFVTYSQPRVQILSYEQVRAVKAVTYNSPTRRKAGRKAVGTRPRGFYDETARRL